jgi:pteridine reductase
MADDAQNHTRVALVTGGAKRVGRAIVRQLAGSGFDVAFTYHRSDEAAANLVRQLQNSGQRVIAIQADLTDASAAGKVFSAFNDHFERLDVLVNNASLYEPSSLEKVTAEQLSRLWAIHVWSPLALCRDFAPALRHTQGHVINMVDLLAEKPWPEYMGYCTTKAGLWNLTLSLARELAPDITVNAIAPGVVEWPEEYPAADRERYLKRVPLNRAGSSDDVAQLVKFLCTKGCYITGQIIRLDGGRSIT